jgi:tetratricopeptide (TPR) repeat protein
VFELHDSIEELPGSTAARKLLVQRSLQYLRSLEASSGRDLSLKWELAEAYKRIGDAQGNTARANLGDSAGALDSYARARGLLRGIIAADEGNLPARNTLEELDRTCADILWDRGRQGESLALQREAIEILRQVAQRNPTLPARKTLALAQWNLATSLTRAQDWPAAAHAWEQTLALYESLPVRRNIALSHKRLASVYMKQNRTPEAVAQLRAAEQIDRESLSAAPASPEAKMDLSFDLSDLGLAFFVLDRYQEAVASYEGALALRREVATADPNDYRARTSVGHSLDRLAVAYQSAGNLPAATRSAREAATILAGVRAHDPANQQSCKEAALALARLGSLYRASADWRGALDAYQRAAAQLDELHQGMSFTEEDKRRIAGIPAALEECRRNLSLRP